MATAAQLGVELAEKRTALAALFDSIKTEDGGYDRSKNPQVIDEIRKREADVNDTASKFKEAVEIEQKADANRRELEYLAEVERPLPFAGKGGYGKGAKGGDGAALTGDLGALFAKNCYTKDGACRKHADIELASFDPLSLKTTMTTAAGFAPENLRSGRVQLSAQRPITLLDLVPMIPIGAANAYVYMLESTLTNAAAEIAENSAGAPESALAYSEQSQAIRRIATFLPVTDEQLEDVVGMQSLINNRLTYMVQARLESQMLAGDGSAPNIDGFYHQVTQAQAKGADPVFDAIFKGMVKVQTVGYATPTAIIMHPNDWQDLRLTRTTDGIYILGNPADAAPQQLFGLTVAPSTAATENTGLVGDFLAHSGLVYRQGVEIKVSDSHSDYFVKFLQAIRVSLRAALVVFRLPAFCEITGI